MSKVIAVERCVFSILTARPRRLRVLSPAKRLHRHPTHHGRYLKSFVYGGLDGAITTFAVVAGVAGAHLSASVVLILGFANLVADGLSMAIGDYLSSKAENEYYKAQRDRGAAELHAAPNEAKRQLRDVLIDKGLSFRKSSAVAEAISGEESVLVDLVLVDRHGSNGHQTSPFRCSAATFLSFLFFGTVPLLAHVASVFFVRLKDFAFPAACLMTAATLFALGLAKVRLTGSNWLLSGFETMAIGGLAATAAYGIGRFLAAIVG